MPLAVALIRSAEQPLGPGTFAIAVHLHLIAVGVVAVDRPAALQPQREHRHVHQVARTGLGVLGLDLGDQVLLGELDQLELLQVEAAVAGQVDEQADLLRMRGEAEIVGEVAPLAVGGGSERTTGCYRARRYRARRG